MAWGVIIVGAVSAGATLYTGWRNRKAAKEQADVAKAERDAQQEKLDTAMSQYKAQTFKNPYANMENVYEDLTVNQQQAQFEKRMVQQQQANIMQDLKGAAGGSGVAALAQTLASQSQLASQRISASIGQQEASNQRLAAKGAASIQNLERQGAQWVQQAEADQQATILGMQMGVTTGANTALAQAQANQMQAQIAQQQGIADTISSLGPTAAENISTAISG